ncbi:hypothetical protein G7077_05835 [Sphingomonas piscis]|uniref:HdeD family acid-resistance protein n=1 Tax=Sphingomonas piscis TaxID=2714943 RepID=A0A6G7YP24_9SPHN|nr:hypothetical protein [Sphingomonas piscis]QIK78493.1 hypothetical protein G7077_05835 [Sphingomonas piscis]
MTDVSRTNSNRHRVRLITAAAVLIIILAAGAALLPLADAVPGANVVGTLLLTAGIIELLAGTQRRSSRIPCMIAGGVTAVAGLLLVLNPVTHIFPRSYLIVAWLILRSLILAVVSTRTGGSVRLWTIVSAATDLALAFILLAGISIATLIVGLFGPTPEVIASFAWILALSFLVTGLWLLETASCERDREAS